MKKNILILLTIGYLFFSCTKESGSITGSWVTGMTDQPQHKHGFSLKDDGTASSINLSEKDYYKWEKQGDRLILFGKNVSNEHSSEFTDTLKIIAVSDSTLVLETSEGGKTTYTKTSNVDKIVTSFETFECYTYQTDKDTAFMHINITENVVRGSLEYTLFEKDSNDGKLSGKINGDTLLASYKFVSEGVESVREIVFLKKGNDWVEGFGDVEEKAGSMVFKDRTKLEFKKGLLFKKTECP